MGSWDALANVNDLCLSTIDVLRTSIYIPIKHLDRSGMIGTPHRECLVITYSY